MTNEEARLLKQQENSRINREKMWQLKLQPCADCKLRWHPQAMTFDHIGRQAMKRSASGKPVSLARITYWNPKVFDMQLQQMSAVCLNCHRIREIKRDIDSPLTNKFKLDEVRELLKQLKKGALL